MKEVTIHSDGGCEGNPGVGGWAAVLQYGPHRKEISGGEAATTNNRMELQAAIEGLRTLNEKCAVRFYTDSQYLREGITEWVAGWKRRGWKTKERTPVKNKDQWVELDRLAAEHQITWHWLKGHAGHKENERCDVLAQKEIARIKRSVGREQLKAALSEFKAAQAAGQVPATEAARGLFS